MTSFTDRAKRVVAKAKASRIGRALVHFGESGGSVMSGGIAYAALFSIFAALTIAFTVGLTVLGRNTELRDAFLDTIDGWVPGLVGEGGALSPSDLQLSIGSGIAGIVAAGVLIWSAPAFMGALGRGLRAMVVDSTPRGRTLPPIVRTWLGFLGLGVALIASTVATVVATQLTAFAGQWGARLAGPAVSFVVDGATFIFVILVVGGIRPPRRDLLIGAAAIGLTFGVVRFLGVGVVASSSEGNSLLAPFAAIITLLVWVNLLARVTLLVTSWVIDPDIEVPLAGGNVGGAVRVGDTVRRPTGPWTPAVHELLAHLEDVGLEGVPRVVGRDEVGREVLTYLPGTPVDLAATTPGQLRAAAVWLGRYHVAVSSFRPDERRWRFTHHAPKSNEILCHNDSTLYNMVFDDDVLAGVLDWDVAGPGLPIDDVGILAWSGLPLYEERPDAEVLERLAVLVAGYAEGLDSGRADFGGARQGLLGALSRSPRLDPVTPREVLEHAVVRMRDAALRIAAAQEAGDEGMLNLRKVDEPARTRAQVDTYRLERLPALLATLNST